MTRPDPAAALPVVRAFSRELSRAGGLLSPDYLASGLTVGEARCLYELGHAGGLEISTLAGRLDLDLGHTSRVVSRLAGRGLVSKRVEPRDARARSVALTRKGAQKLAVLDRHANRRLGAWLATKPAPAVDQLLGGLRAFVGEAAARAADNVPGAAPGRVSGRPRSRAPGQPDPAPGRVSGRVSGRVIVRGPRPGEIGHMIARHGELYARDSGYPPVFEHYVVQAFASFLARPSPTRDRIWIAEQDGRFAGSIAVKGLPDRTSQLRFLIVEPEARGHGVGRQLVEQVLEHARAAGDRKLVLDTASDLPAARAIYASVGFCKVASTAGEPFLPAGVDSERWELDLVSETAGRAGRATAARSPRRRPGAPPRRPGPRRPRPRSRRATR